MREKRPFAQRSSVSGRKEALRKYFLVYEGENTESIYFDGIIANRDKIGINPLMANIDKAIRNEKLFCEDEETLLNTAGSRVGLLITELRTN